MPKDVIITPASGLVDFQSNTGISSATIQLDDNGNLNIANPGGDLTIGDTNRDIFIGDGVNNVDIVFEQDGEIRGITNKTIGLGQTDSYIKIVGGLKDANNSVGVGGSILISTGSGVVWSSATGAGAQGLQGNQGRQGSQGLQGSQGTQGLQGSQGSQGTQGLQGNQGRQGSQGTQGLQGSQGSQGLQGTQGLQGIAGQNAGQGSQGSQGTQGLQGNQGRQGSQGIAGQNAGQGSQGSQGLQGTQGSQGLQGLQGSPAAATTPSTITRTSFTATEGQTTFSVSYTPNFILVYLNGSNLDTTEYTASNGTTVVLGTGASVQDIVEVVSFTLGNYVSSPQGTQGRQGTQGLLSNFQGTQGTQGLQGLQGNQGRQGSQGAIGPGNSASNFDVLSTTANSTFYPVLVSGVGLQAPNIRDTTTSFSFNPGTGELISNGLIEAGRGTGSVALTLNDGYGNANVAFNHKAGTPDVSGSSGRIVCDVDSATAGMSFQLGSSTVAATPVGLTAVLTMSTTAATFSGTVTANSDESIKTNIKPIENALEKVLQLRGVEFTYKEHGTKSIGVIAQEIEKVFPELVYGNEIKSVAYQNLVAVLIEAIKELNDKYESRGV